mgnify:CR=1 FL=1
MRPTRLAFILPGLVAGGAERVVSSLANFWAEHDHEVAIITFESRETKPFYTIDSRIKLICLGIPTGMSSRWQSLELIWRRIRDLRIALRALNPEVIVSFLTRVNVITLAASRGLGIPVIISERNNPENQRASVVWSWARALFYPTAFAFVTMTARALSFYPEAQRPRARLIPNPITVPKISLAHRSGRTLTAVGRLVPQKGFDLLLRAFAAVASEFSEWNLVIWGEGELRSDLEAQRDRLGFKERVKFPGLTKSPGVWIETADVFVLSSRFEGWANVLAEALGAGLPIVAFDCAYGPAEMIEDGVSGVLVAREDVGALAAALRSVLGSSSLREKLGVAAAERAKQFTVPAIAQRWEELFIEALEHETPARAPTSLPPTGLAADNR